MPFRRSIRLYPVLAALAGLMTTVPWLPAAAHTLHPSADWVGETGMASYYGRSHQGRVTASGTRFNRKEMTAAHPWLPFGSKVRVTLLRTGRSIVVVVTDRLPSHGRVIDLSAAAARQLGMHHAGVARVSLAPALSG